MGCLGYQILSERIVYISPYQLGALAALGTVVNLPELLTDRDPINVDAIVYGSMIQCGVEIFEIPKAHIEQQKSAFSQSRFLKARISSFSDRKGMRSGEVVKNAFRRLLPSDYEENSEFSGVTQLEQFITDLVFATERKTSYMTLFPVPEITKFENKLPAELFFPVKNLLDSFEPLNPSLPYLKLSAMSADINKFEQLLSSDLFSRYVAQHAKLEQNSISTKSAIENVVEGGKGMLQNNIDFLQLKQMTISVLPITAKLIDVIFGKLPGALADYFANLLTGLLKDEKRIVVYQLNSIFKDLVKTYVVANVKKG